MKVAVISGGSRGIGLAAVSRLISEEYSVVILGRSMESIRIGLESIGSLSDDVHSIETDVSDANSVKNAFQEIYSKYKGLDVLICNAGVIDSALIGMVTEEKIHRVFGINVNGVLYCCQYGSRLMARRGGGSIINVSSIMGVSGAAGQSVYASSKAAVIGITKSLAKELAPSNIRVNAIAPGFIDTEMARSISPEKFQERLDSIKMGRIGKPEEVASVISFLAGDDSKYVTGQVIGVDGGMLI
jgi:3-oxoacyl-[acyl-carrier protein] reductase